MLKVFRFIRFLSLDIVLGVVAGSILACRLTEFNPPISYKFLLPLAVWILYLTDHLIDGLRHAHKSNDSRYHAYHKKSKPLLILVVLLTILALGILIFSFDVRTFHFGILVGIIVILYFIFQQLRFREKIKAFPKEPIIAIVYTIGIWGEPVFMLKEAFHPALLMSILAFGCIALMNVQLFSILQVKEDIDSGYPSLAVAIGAKFVSGLNYFIGIVVVTINVINIYLNSRPEFKEGNLLLLIMVLCLLILNTVAQNSSRKEIISILSDAVFYIPFGLLVL